MQLLKLRVLVTRNARLFSAQATPIMVEYPPTLIRNFSIIAHIDHGKSTLADRLLELTGTIATKSAGLGSNKQVLDKLKVERERGITVKAQTASMFYEHNKQTCLLNLIDTPGHVDFSWEVARSLSACQGALLLVDATQGIEAQTISVFHIAKERGLKIIPILNKIDLPQANPELISAQMCDTFGLDPADVIHVSAKTGLGVSKVLQAIVERVPPPTGWVPTQIEAGQDSRIDKKADVKGEENVGPLKALLFDSEYDRYRGVISLVNVHSGIIKKGDKIASCYTRQKYDVVEVGIMYPEHTPTEELRPGQVGYFVCNMKESSEALIGDTFHHASVSVEPLEGGFKPARAMVYAGVFPVDSNDFTKLEESIKRLVLTDRSVTIQRESSTALGQGCRLGFLGTLHMDVFRQRLEDEYDANVIVTAPTVPYKVIYKKKTVMVSNPTDFPDAFETSHSLVEIQEPMTNATIIVPQDYLGDMMDLCSTHRAQNIDHRYLDSAGTNASQRVILTARLPLSEIVTDFFDKLKHRSSGFASFDYEDAGYEPCNLKKMTFHLNSKPVDALALIVHPDAVHSIGRIWTKRLREVIPRHLFEVAIQAVVGSKVVARETISAMRKDVTAGLYGGHYERKLKHLNKQKEGKKMMKKIGSIELPQAAFFDVLKADRK